MDLICEVALTTIKKGRSWLGQLSNRNGACGHVVEPSPEVCEVCLIEGPKIKKKVGLWCLSVVLSAARHTCTYKIFAGVLSSEMFNCCTTNLI